MNRRLALVAIAALTLVALALPAVASASAPLSVRVEPAASTYAAGSEALFLIVVTGDEPSSATLDFAVEGGTLTGALSLNDIAPGIAQGGVYVRRETTGLATLVALLDGEEVARGSVEFVEGAPITVSLTLEADTSAAARTWPFAVVNGDGVTVDFVHAGASGDALTGTAVTQPLPFGTYTVKPALGRDASGACTGNTLFAVTPVSGVDVEVTAAGDARASFAVRPCTALEDGTAPGGQSIDAVAGTRTAPLPPATGNGQRERPTLPEGHARQLVGLLLATGLSAGIGIVVVRFLAQVAPVQKKKK